MKKKTLRILLIAVGALIVAAAGVVTALKWNDWFGEKEVVKTEAKGVYWNVDRDKYAYQSAAFTSSRDVDKNDGYYHILFSQADQMGRQVTRRVKEKSVVDKIDTMYCMSLVFDEDGIVVDAIPIEELGDTYACKRCYVMEDQVAGQPVLVNTSDSLDGQQISLTIPTTALMIDVSGSSGDVGMSVDLLKIDDCVYAVGDKSGNIKYVYITNRVILTEIYWNVARKWNSTTKSSTREPDAEGWYYFLLACNGEQATYKTKDIKIVRNIDAVAAKCFGLTVDEEGIITSFITAKNATNGNSFASWYNIDSIEGNTLTATKYSAGSDKGNTVTGTMAKNCKVFDVTGVNDVMVGAYSEIKVGDQIHGLCNSKGEVVYIFIVGGRTVNSDIYWNTSRKYTTSTKTWTRQPDADGWYVFKLGVGSKGIIQEFKTKDAAVAREIDEKYPARCFGLKLNGNIILGTYATKQVTGGGSFGSWYNIDSIEGKTVTATKYSSGSDIGTTVTGTLSDDCLIINTADNCKFSKLSVGDQIHGLLNNRAKVSVVFIISKAPTVVKTAYCSHCNQTVKWYEYTANAAKNGYHYVVAADNNNAPQFNVGSIGTAENIQKYNAGQIASVEAVLDLNGHRISGANRAIAVGLGSKLTVIDSVGGGVITSSNPNVGAQGAAIWLNRGSECNFYAGNIDMTGINNTYVGGAVALEQKSVFNMYGGTIKNGTSVPRLSGTAYTAGQGGNLYLNNNSTFNMYGGTITGGTAKAIIYINSKGVNTTQGGQGGNVFINNGAVFNMNGGTVSGGIATSDAQDITTGGGNVFINGEGASKNNGVFNLNNGTVSGGVASIGGNIRANNGIINVSGGTVSGGVAQFIQKLNSSGSYTKFDGHGGNIFSNNKINISGGTISGGKATFIGGGNFSVNSTNSSVVMTGGTIKDGVSPIQGRGNVYLWNNDNATFDMRGGIITDTENFAPESGYFAGGLYYSNGVLKLSGSAQITGNTDYNLYIASGKKITVSDLNADARFGITAGGVFAQDAKDYLTNFYADDSNNAVRVKDEADLEIYRYCLCEDCGQVVEWKIWTGESIKESGHYYLASGVTISSQAIINHKSGLTNYASGADEGVNVTIDLNGFTLTSSKRAIVVNNYHTLNIVDHSAGKTGTIAAAANSDTTPTQGRGIWVRNNGTCNIYGGTIDMSNAPDDGYYGQAIALDGGTLNMYGGTVKNGHVVTGSKTNSGYGGNIFVNSTATFNMYGGTVTGGSAQRGGANIASAGAVSISGGVVDGGLHYISGSVAAVAPAVINGDSIVTVENETTAYVFDAQDNAETPTVSGNAPALAEALNAGGRFAIGHVHCLECGTVACKEHHNVAFLPWTTATSLPKASNYYLETDITTSAQSNTLTDITFCLNGHQVKGTSTSTTAGRLFLVGYNATTSKFADVALNICDCSPSATGKITRTHSSFAGTGALIQVGDTADLNIYSGTLDAGGIVTTKNGAAIFVSINSTFNMYGGTVIGGKANIGGSVYSVGDCFLHGGTVKDGFATANGGNVAVLGGTFTVDGENAVIENGRSQNGGGNVYISGGTFILKNGTVRDGLTRFDDAKQDVKEVYGGNIYLSSSETGKFYMTGGTVSGGRASNGGNLYTASSSSTVCELTGGTISGGLAYRVVNIIASGTSQKGWGGQGGNAYISSTVLIDGVTITGGKSDGSTGGANIALKDSKADVTMNSGLITDGQATDSVRNNLALYYTGSAVTAPKFTMNGGEITGGVFYRCGTFTVSKTAKITGGSTNIYLYDTKLTVGELAEGAAFGITMRSSGTGVFAESAKNYAEYFTCDNTAFEVVVSGEDLVVAAK